MRLEGGCYCGKLRYVAEGQPILNGQCHCRECQYITGGSANVFIMMPADGFSFAKGEAKQFTRSDLEKPATRYFCADCGTHIASKRSGPIVLKVGTLDDPKQTGLPQIAIHTLDKQPYHSIPEGCVAFERMPPSR
jgi:hypothetical protein